MIQIYIQTATDFLLNYGVNLIAGLGFFLYGISIFETMLESLANSTFKKILKSLTDNTIKSTIFGLVGTTLVQSSTLISLLSMSFAGVGIITLGSAIGILIGANIGTTTSGLRIAQIGFNLQNSVFSLLCIGIGGIGSMISSRNSTIGSILRIIFGFGLLLFGLDYMKSSVSTLANSFDFSFFVNYHYVVFIVIGIIGTILINSSSVFIAIVLAAINGGIIDLSQGIALAIGANLGTTSTAILAAIGGKAIKKQVAGAHVLLNAVGTSIGIIFFEKFVYFISEYLGYRSNPVLGLAVFNIYYNLITVLPFVVLVTPLSWILKKIFPDHGSIINLRLLTLQSTIPEEILHAVNEDGLLLAKKVFKFNLNVLGIDQKKLLAKRSSPKTLSKSDYFLGEDIILEEYNKLKHYEGIIFELSQNSINESRQKQDFMIIGNAQKAIIDLVYGAKLIKDISHNLQELKKSDNDQVLQNLQNIKLSIAKIYKNIAKLIEGENTEDLYKMTDIELSELITFETTPKKKSKKTEINKSDIIALNTINRAISISTKNLLDAINGLR